MVQSVAGLKGSLNEYELDLLRQRSVEARRAKAQRGELRVAAPVGYLKTDAPHLEKDPNRRIQEAVELVFRKFSELGSVRQTLSWFLEHGLQLPARSVSGEITWRRPSYGVLYRMLTNPNYGGAYAYGKTEHTLQYDHGEPRAGSRRRPREEWLAFIPHAHEGYVSGDEFDRIQQTMAANVRGWDRTGAATTGPALLTGLLRCRRCGRKLVVCYTGTAHNVLRYGCVRGARDNGEPRCISFGGLLVDDAMAKEILRVVQPAAIDAAVVASDAAAQQQDDVLNAWTRDLEAARYAARRAQKQYDATDPDNRLVAAVVVFGKSQIGDALLEVSFKTLHRRGVTVFEFRDEIVAALAGLRVGRREKHLLHELLHRGLHQPRHLGQDVAHPVNLTPLPISRAATPV